MIDKELQSFLRSGDPALPVDPARIQNLTDRILADLGPQTPRVTPRWPRLARALTFGVLLCASGLLTGRAMLAPQQAVQTIAQGNGATVMAMASPWDEWIEP